jgi:hypothetical protein
MNGFGRAFAVLCIWLGTSVAWLVLGGVMQNRVGASARDMSARVEGLWGREQTQRAPTAIATPLALEPGSTPQGTPTPPTSTALDVDLRLDQRLKGLRWFSLYDVGFDGTWTFQNELDGPATLRLEFPLPDADGVYDDVRFVVNGEPIEVVPEGGSLRHDLVVEAGDEVALEVGYRSRGMEKWVYEPKIAGSASVLRDFS